jgi:hypothetical protein
MDSVHRESETDFQFAVEVLKMVFRGEVKLDSHAQLTRQVCGRVKPWQDFVERSAEPIRYLPLSKKIAFFKRTSRLNDPHTTNEDRRQLVEEIREFVRMTPDTHLAELLLVLESYRVPEQTPAEAARAL